MKNKIALALVVGLILLGITGCQNAQPQEQRLATAFVTNTAAPAEINPPTTAEQATDLPPAAVATEPPAPTVEPSPTPTVLEATATKEPTAAPTLQAATDVPATLEATSTGAAEVTSSDLRPVEGSWAGSATNLLINFVIRYVDNQMMLSDLAVLYFGPGECTIDLIIPDATPIQPEKFTRFFKSDETYYDLTGKFESETLIIGNIIVHPEDCGKRSIQWIASPKQP